MHMAGSHKLAIWQARMKIYIENRLKETNLQDRLDAIRKSLVDSGNKELATLMTDYDLPLNSYPLLSHYLTTGIWDYKVIDPPVKIVSHKEGIALPSDKPRELYALLKRLQQLDGDHAIYLRIDRSLSKKEFSAFIDNYWNEIKSRLHNDGYLTSRIRIKKNALRDKRIMELFSAGWTFTQILVIVDEEFPSTTPLTVENIRVIVGKMIRKSKD